MAAHDKDGIAAKERVLENKRLEGLKMTSETSPGGRRKIWIRVSSQGDQRNSSQGDQRPCRSRKRAALCVAAEPDVHEFIINGEVKRQ